MRLLRLDPSQGYKKSARIVGDVIGKFHPHGDQSIYDALVRLAQDFALRYPLVDGQGNFGNIDGDSPAAMRYTESRMTDVAMRLLEGITENAIDFKPTYDGEDEEPTVLPANFPNLLANGSTASRWAWRHRCRHITWSSSAMRRSRSSTIPASPPPTSSIPIPRRRQTWTIWCAGRTFRPAVSWWKPARPWSMPMRPAAARSGALHLAQGGQGARRLSDRRDANPYGVQKSRLVEKIAELLLAKKLPLLKDVRDESADDIRLVLEPRAGTVDAVILMEQLFKVSELEVRFPLNLNVLDKGAVPKVMGLAETLKAWLDHRKIVLVRRSQHRLEQIANRLEVLEGYIVAYLNLDEVIRIIREEDDAKASLIAAFNLTDNQAEAILNMRLRSLRKLEELELRQEHKQLSEEKGRLETLLASDKRLWGEIAKQVESLKKVYPLFDADGTTPHKLGARRTIFGAAPTADAADINEAFIEREPITVILSEKGWIRAPKGHNAAIDEKGFKTGDRLKLSFNCETTDKLLMMTTGGKVYTLGADKLPGGRGQGEPVRLMVDIEEGQDIVAIFVYRAGAKRLIASSNGYGFVVGEDDLIANTRKGKQILNVSAPDEARLIVPCEGDRVAVIGQNRKLLVFPMSQLAEMTRGKGVRLQRYKDGDISDIKTFYAADGLPGRTRRGAPMPSRART